MSDDPFTLDVGLDVAGHVGIRSSSVSLDLIASASLNLPGLQLAVEKLRGSLSLALLPSADGLALTPTFTIIPPAGASAELLLPGFSGGGYLDKVGDEWRGALGAQLGPISVSGFGIISTDHFSMLVLLAAEFTPPIQLSFGFTLVGVGGLIGINRKPDSLALQDAVSSGDLSHLLFPQDPVADAPKLLPVLSKCFPYSDGDFVIGPMMKLGWGTPTLVAATIGVLVSSGGVIILGRVAITLPFEQAALIRLEALVLGTIDENGLAVNASLANSQIVGFPVEGDIRLRLKTGSDAMFAFSAGGFHPSFSPPEGMGGMKRIGMEISPGAILRARLAAYLAVTTDSVQFGTNTELEAGIAGFGIKGHFSFDALIVLDPFGFMADFSAGVSIECADFEVGSIDLAGHFSGPSPWRIRGHASFSILWWDIDVDIPEITFGSADPPSLPPARDPFAVLADQLHTPANWTATSRDVPSLVHLRPGVDRDTTAIHPLAQVSFRQNAVPLDIDLQRMDGVPLTSPITLRVAPAPAAPALQMKAVLFPPSQFREQDDKARLSSAGYATFDGGFDVEPAAPGARPVQSVQGRSDIDPETTVLGKGLFLGKVICALAAGVATQIGHGQVAPPPRAPLITLRDPGVAVITTTHDLSDATGTLAAGYATGNAAMAAASGGIAGAAANAGVAEQLISQFAALDPIAAGGMQVARAWEVG